MTLKELIDYWPLFATLTTFLGIFLAGIYSIVRYFYLETTKRITGLEERISKLEDFKTEYYKSRSEQKELYNWVRDREPLIRRYTMQLEQIDTMGIVNWIQTNMGR